MNFLLVIFALTISLFNSLPIETIEKRGPTVACWNVFTGLLSLKQKAATDEFTGWYQSMEENEQEKIYMRMSGISASSLQHIKTTSKDFQKIMSDFVMKTFVDRKPLIDQVSPLGIDKVALATMERTSFPSYKNVLSQHIKSLPSANGKTINFFGANPAWNDNQMNAVVQAHKAALDMVSKMVDWINKKPNSKEFTDFFGSSSGAKNAVLNRLQAIQDQEQLNVYLVNKGQTEVAHAVFSGGVSGSGGMGDSLNLMGINVESRPSFFDLPAYPKKMLFGGFGGGDIKTLIRSETSAAGFIIHEISHMFGTEDVTGDFVNQNGLSGTCYGRQSCIDLASGAVQNPSDAPYNNADSYQFFANEVYLFEDFQQQEIKLETEVEQKFHVKVDPPTETDQPLIKKDDPMIGILKDLMKYDPEGAKNIMTSLGIKSLE